MIVVHINSSNFGSTGGIMNDIAKMSGKYNHTIFVCFPKSRDNQKSLVYEKSILIGNRVLRNLHLKLAKISGLNGCFSICDTIVFINKIKKISPDIIHLHNLHNCYINLPLLFKYIKKNNIRVIWTLHDCWAFTGECPHFTLVKCSKWKSGCKHCIQYKEYPYSNFDNTKLMWNLKKKWFTQIRDITFVTPSKWLANLVKQSYLKKHQIKVINNGVDLSVFKQVNTEFKKNKNIEDKYMILGVSYGWNYKKGLDIFNELEKKISNNFVIVLVGINKEEIKDVSKNIITIERTNSKYELAEIYSAADVFVNPTREEVLGLVNLEANACGTPVITFNSGGAPECIDSKSGYVIDVNDIESLQHRIHDVCIHKSIKSEDCIKSAERFNKNLKYKEYFDLYSSIYHGGEL